MLKRKIKKEEGGEWDSVLFRVDRQDPWRRWHLTFPPFLEPLIDDGGDHGHFERLIDLIKQSKSGVFCCGIQLGAIGRSKEHVFFFNGYCRQRT